jgi:NADPH:quinone reductase-like Zn-dependent oxidoreductase
MKAVELRALGVENLVLGEHADPTPGPGEVVVRMRAASLNFRDLVVARGGYGPRMKLPLVPLSDGAGDVVAVGDGVREPRVGDRVLACFFQDWPAGPPTRRRLVDSLGGPLDGTLRERMVLRANGVVRLPEHFTFEEAATLPCAAVTAYNALAVLDRVGPEHTVLVQGTGGVSLFALQIAKMLGARVIVTSKSDAKLERARELGADHGINYVTTPDWGGRAKELTGGEGVDHVVEVGGAGTLEQSLRAVAVGGCVSLVGVLAGAERALRLPLVFLRQVRLQGVVVGSRETTERMLRAMGTHRLRPVVDERRFAMAEIRDALTYLAAGEHFGKVAIRIDERA